MRLLLTLTLVALTAVVTIIMGVVFTESRVATIRIGTNPWPGYEALFLAQERGLFAKHALPVKLIEFTSVGDCLRGFQQGDVDGMASTLVEVGLAEQLNFSGKPIPVLVADSSLGADMILARPGLTTFADLRGKRVAVETASLGIFILNRALALNHMHASDIAIVQLGQEGMAQALSDGRADAVVTYSPYSVAAIKQGAVTVFTTKEIPDEVIDIISVTPQVLADHPDFILRLRKVWADAEDLIAHDNAASIALMAKRQRITPDEFRDSLTGISLCSAADQKRLLAPGGAVERALAQVKELVVAPVAK